MENQQIIQYQRGKITEMGMELDLWKYESCVCRMGVGEDFATIYHIESEDKNKGHATMLIKIMRIIYFGEKKEFATSVALSAPMKHIVKKLNLTEYK